MNIIKKVKAIEYTFEPAPDMDIGQGNPGQILTQVISNLVGILSVLGLIWFLIQIILAGYQFISAGGDSQKIKDAQQKLQNSFIGAIIVISAIFLFMLLGELLGIDSILDLGGMIERMSP